MKLNTLTDLDMIVLVHTGVIKTKTWIKQEDLYRIINDKRNYPIEDKFISSSIITIQEDGKHYMDVEFNKVYYGLHMEDNLARLKTGSTVKLFNYFIAIKDERAFIFPNNSCINSCNRIETYTEGKIQELVYKTWKSKITMVWKNKWKYIEKIATIILTGIVSGYLANYFKK